MLPKRKEPRYSLASKEIQDHMENGRNMIWESQNGKQTILHSMDDNHLINAIAKIERGDHEFYDYSVLNTLMMELEYRDLNNNNTDLKKILRERQSKRKERVGV